MFGSSVAFGLDKSESFEEFDKIIGISFLSGDGDLVLTQIAIEKSLTLD